jgi:hypothetical protein
MAVHAPQGSGGCLMSLPLCLQQQRSRLDETPSARRTLHHGSVLYMRHQTCTDARSHEVRQQALHADVAGRTEPEAMHVCS